MAEKKRIRIKVLGTIPGHPVGSIVDMDADPRGVPLTPSWRRRLLDAKIDGCCEVIPDSPAETITEMLASSEGIEEFEDRGPEPWGETE